jgi:hypothetical protein
VLENRVLIIFGPKREEVVGDWRRLHNEELHNLYNSNIVRVIWLRIRWARHIAHRGEMRNEYTILVGKSEWDETTQKTKA